MKIIKEIYFHIKGTPHEDEVFETVTDNYVHAKVGYEKGKGYFWQINRSGRYTWQDGDINLILNAFQLGDRAPFIHECLVPCGRAGKAKEREAIELFDSNVVSAIIHRLGYDIELD